MQELNIRGASRRRWATTTTRDDRFKADAPNKLWVADITVTKITSRFNRIGFEYERQLLLKNPIFELVVGKLISKSWIKPEVNKDVFQNSLEFTQAYLKEPYLWKSAFNSLGHWIPEFLWFGLWLSTGEE